MYKNVCTFKNEFKRKGKENKSERCMNESLSDTSNPMLLNQSPIKMHQNPWEFCLVAVPFLLNNNG